MFQAIAPLAMGGLGAWAGSKKDKSSQRFYMDLGEETALEGQARKSIGDSFGVFEGMVKAGPGDSDVRAAYGAQKSLADLLLELQTNSQPGYKDIEQANSLATNLFQARRLGLQNSFQDQLTQANRSAALMGRDMNDPILRAKLAEAQTRQSSMLDAEQNVFATQQAMNSPFQRFNIAAQRTNLLSGLATQAMQNRQALLGLGSNLMASERQWRMGIAPKTNYSESGGGAKGAILGGMAGFGAGMQMAPGDFSGMGQQQQQGQQQYGQQQQPTAGNGYSGALLGSGMLFPMG
jgi:hypothetical protein